MRGIWNAMNVRTAYARLDRHRRCRLLIVLGLLNVASGDQRQRCASALVVFGMVGLVWLPRIRGFI